MYKNLISDVAIVHDLIFRLKLPLKLIILFRGLFLLRITQFREGGKGANIIVFV
jgi:hypothetical protein